LRTDRWSRWTSACGCCSQTVTQKNAHQCTKHTNTHTEAQIQTKVTQSCAH
jgi:hypothetical protein